MTVQVVARRFVNTPTILELYKEEHPGEEHGVSQDQVDDLSDEYDKVTGNEAYSLYRTLFEKLPTPHAHSVVGAEGFLEWAKDTVQKLIEGVKTFFKWLWSLVSSKQKAMDMKVDGLKEKLKSKGVKTVATKYPKGYVDLWGSASKVPGELQWMVAALGKAKGRIEDCETYAKDLEVFLEKINGYLRPGHIYESEEAFRKDHAAFVEKTSKTFVGSNKGKTVPFVGTFTVAVDDKGHVHLNVDTKLAALGKNPPDFITSTSEVNSVIGALELASNKMEDLNTKLSRLEGSILKDLDALLKTTASVDHGKHKASVEYIVDTLKDVVTSSISAIKSMEQACYKPLSAATSILTAALAKG